MKHFKTQFFAVFTMCVFIPLMHAQTLFPGGASFPGIECKYDTFDYSSFVPTATTFSGNSLVHTPKGELHALATTFPMH